MLYVHQGAGMTNFKTKKEEAKNKEETLKPIIKM